MVQAFSNEAPWRRSRIVVPVANPAAGADWSFTVPAGHVYRLVSVFAQLVTSAVVANRQALLTVTDGTGTFLRLPAAAVQAASGTVTYSWMAGGVAYLSLPASQAAFLPDLNLMPAWGLASSTALIDVGDQWSGIRLHVIDTTVKDAGVDIDAIPDVIVEVLAPSANGAS